MAAGQLMRIAEDHLPGIVGNGSDRSRSTRLGLALGRERGRIFAGFRLQEVEIADEYSRARTAWSLVPLAREFGTLGDLGP